MTVFNWIYTNTQNLQGIFPILANKINVYPTSLWVMPLNIIVLLTEQEQTMGSWDAVGPAGKVFKCYERVRCGSSGQTDVILRLKSEPHI